MKSKKIDKDFDECSIHGKYENSDEQDVCPICEYINFRENWVCPKCNKKLKDGERYILHNCPPLSHKE